MSRACTCILAFPRENILYTVSFFPLLACVREGGLVAVAMLAERKEGRKDFWGVQEREREREMRDAVGCVHRDVSDTRAE
jgi:hypothetical protein